MKKDIISKEAVKGIIKTILDIFLNKKVQNIEFLDKEFERVENKRADIVVLADEEIYHIEIQSNFDKKMALRMMRYYTDIKFSYNYPVNQMVIYLGKGNLPNTIKEKKFTYTFDVIDMKKIDCNLFLEKNDPNALVLSILCDFKGKLPNDVVRIILEKLYKLSKNEFSKYVLMLEELSDLRNLQEVVKEEEMFLTEKVKLQDLPSFQLGVEFGEKKAKKQGIIKGKVLMMFELGYKKEDISKKLNISIKEIEDILKEENNGTN